MGDLERRLSAQTSINRIATETAAPNFDENGQADVEAYADLLADYWRSAQQAHDNLITADELTTALRIEHTTALAKIEKAYVRALARIKGRLLHFARLSAAAAAQNAVIRQPEQAVPTNEQDNRMVELLEGVRLDATRLPKFDGDRNKWLKFYEDFKVNVNDKTYPDLVKMSPLRECLSGPALRVIDAAAPADGNTYAGAWAALKERYDNKRFLVNSHLTNIFEFKLNGKFDLLRMVDTFEATIRALDALEVDATSWDAVLSFLFLKKLDDATRAAWEMSQVNGELPKFSELLKFIKRRANSFDFAQMGSSDARSPHQPKMRALVHSVTGTGRGGGNCVICGQDHRVLMCSKFNSLPPNRRFTLIRTDKDLCYNCLQSGHFTQSCPSGNCRHCNGRHHSALCRSDAAMAAFLASQAKHSAQQHTHGSSAAHSAMQASA